MNQLKSGDMTGRMKNASCLGNSTSGFISWQHMLIIGNTVYRREDGIYRKTKESLQDRLNLEDDLVCYSFTQWENLLLVYRDNWISVFNSNFEQLVFHTFDGYIDCVFQGKVYYRDQNWKSMLCMDLLSGEVEVIYDGEGASYFMVRDNGDMILSVIKGTVEDGRIWEYWLFSYDEQSELKANKIWETEKYKYKYMEMWEFNDRGLFFIGETYSAGADTLCLHDNGEIEKIMETNSWVPEGQIITGEGYFQWDSQIIAEEEKEEILGSWDWNRPREAETVIDSISYYDFQDNKLGTWQLIDDEMLEIGYRLANIVYGNGEIIALYENEEFADLYISKVQVQ